MSKRVLAVEDTPSLRALLQLCLTRGGYAVELAENGQQAVELFGASVYDAVVMDIQMPLMDGLTAVGLMREKERSAARAAVPMLALTANTEPADLRRCLDAGFTATVRKPFGRDELLNELSKTLNAGAAGRRIRVTADPDFAAMIPGFLDNCRHEAAAMKDALTRGDYHAIITASHKISGSGGTFGFEPLSRASHLVELAAKKADAAQVGVHLQEIDAYLENVNVVYP